MTMFAEISDAAEVDLEEIFDYTLTQHGADQALEYVTSFDSVFNNLILHPYLGRDRSDIRQGLRSILKDHHIIFYRTLDDRIRIVRILHGSRDLPRQFGEGVE